MNLYQCNYENHVPMRISIRFTTNSFRSELASLFLIILASLSICRDVKSDDWPQILGIHRDGIAVNETLATRWPNNQPRVNWRYKLGQGFAGVSVSGNDVFVFHRMGNQERIESLHRDTGNQQWKRDLETFYRGGYNPDSGPRCVPTVAGDRIILHGASGLAHAVRRQNGELLWSRDLVKDYQGEDGFFGAGSTPIVVDEKALFNIGGEKTGGIVALNVENGETIWHQPNEGASYSSPITAEIDGKTFAIFVTRFNTVMLDPEDGDVAFKISFGRRGPTVNAATPLVFDSQLFLTSSYNVGAGLFELSRHSARELWRSDDSLSSQYNSPILWKNDIYGIHGREDVGQAELRCINPRSGLVRWKKKNFGVANLILADHKILAVKVDGELVIFEPNPDRYVELARTKLSNKTTRALPALSRGLLFIRDSDELICFDLNP